MEYVIADKWGASSVKSILDSLNNNKSAAFNRHKGKLAQSYSNIWNQLDINNRMLLMGQIVPGRSLNDKGWALLVDLADLLVLAFLMILISHSNVIKV